MNGTAILKNDPMMGAIFADRILRGDDALHDEEIRGPVAEGNHPAETQHNARPVNAHGVVGKAAHRPPEVRVVTVGKILVDARHEAAPAAGFNQAENGNQQRAKPDQEELQDLVENRRK